MQIVFVPVILFLFTIPYGLGTTPQVKIYEKHEHKTKQNCESDLNKLLNTERLDTVKYGVCMEFKKRGKL